MKAKTGKQQTGAKAAPSVVAEDDSAFGAADRLEYIAKAAYYRAEARGFVPGMEMDDWLQAEAQYETAMLD